MSSLALLCAACAEHEPGLTGAQSLAVTLLDPADPGGPDDRLPDTARDVAFDVKALDAQGHVDRSFNGSVDLYVFYLGTLNAQSKPVVLANGEGDGAVTLPVTFGQTYIWLEDASVEGGRKPTYATGTSPILWYRDPTLEDVSKPAAGQPPLYRSPLEGKQVTVSTSRFGPTGRLVVTGVYAQGFTVSDVGCDLGTCAAYPYGHLFVYSFSRPRDDRGRSVQLGQTVSYVAGGVSEFNGFTELNFPQTGILDETPDEGLVPAPVPIVSDWLLNPGAMVALEEQESALVMVENVTVCALDSDYDRFKQWKVNIGLGCGKPINVVTAGQVAGLDPADLVGQPVKRIVGTLKGVNFSSFNVWIVQPRRPSDITIE